jgi:hypothetical protein
MAPQVRANGKRRLEEAKLAKRLSALVEVPESVDPRDALAAELCRCVGIESVLRSLVGALELGEGGIYRETHHNTGRRTGEAKQHVLISMWQNERDRLRVVAVEAAKAGVEAHRVAIEQERGELIAQLFRAVLEAPELKLTTDQQAQGMLVAAKQLRQLTAVT